MASTPSESEIISIHGSPDTFLLEHSWRMWMHDYVQPGASDEVYAQSRRIVGDNPIRTVEYMWRHINNPYTIEELSYGNSIEGTDSVSFFVEGVVPDWKHPANVNGSTMTFKCRRPSPAGAQCWADLIMGVMGLDGNRNGIATALRDVVGMRQVVRRCVCRFEIWLTRRDYEEAVYKWMVDLMESNGLYQEDDYTFYLADRSPMPENPNVPAVKDPRKPNVVRAKNRTKKSSNSVNNKK